MVSDRNLQASNEVVTEEVVAMKERLFRLENQLANTQAPSVHYHDNRTVVIVIEGIGKYHVEEATENLPVLWYNKHNTGAKNRKVRVMGHLLTFAGVWPCSSAFLRPLYRY